ncbi:N-acetylmuramidase domain-containing protein [Paraburkholderia sp.]|uniref:N-acetylmuramidase domain-containing protein n=1 Tax=Paraburkholderia sp. TaxID=1926495 RepID=UPI003445FBA7
MPDGFEASGDPVAGVAGVGEGGGLRGRVRVRCAGGQNAYSCAGCCSRRDVTGFQCVRRRAMRAAVRRLAVYFVACILDFYGFFEPGRGVLGCSRQLFCVRAGSPDFDVDDDVKVVGPLGRKCCVGLTCGRDGLPDAYRYARLDNAYLLDRDAAIQPCLRGKCRVLGEKVRALFMRSPLEFLEVACTSERVQLFRCDEARRAAYEKIGDGVSRVQLAFGSVS